ncbi:hypothetical protein BJ875DRAFT_48726 [Amylocarpus encephaloides]|uniref:Uncharacterized protein n=1 Tax=Amylocarpus encephaloides TaxID=45428 RepID=A0A9P7YR55_9HELO|nr:hypothetical protein BJ875DRAFT_48726 [Amylocarpus encephaloides]
MAFRHSTYHAPPRVYTLPNEEQSQALATALAVRPDEGRVADSYEWILFSPSAESTTDRAYTTSTARTRTAGRSRISDLGSLDTAARSNAYNFDERSEKTEDVIEGEEEDGELDSLDSHLHEFGQEPSVYRPSGLRESGELSNTVLPTHDGLGSFRIDRTMMGEDVQEQLYAFEQYNPRRVKRRREGLEIGQLELENERAAGADRTRRIEEWRMGQSRLLVDEIQKETRRRKQSFSSERRSVVVDREQEDLATMSAVESVDSHETEVASDENESFWNRITKRVIQDLMGIDDDLLSIIFGESIPLDDDLSTTPPANRHIDSLLIPANQSKGSSWEYRLLERIAKELGLLVNQLSDHPGAFSTYLQTQQTPLPSAGLPAIPESSRDQQLSSQSTITTSPQDPEFIPTLQAAHAIPIPAATTSLASAPPIDEDATPRRSTTLTREEWERDLDIKMVFRYLRSRFTGKSSPSSSPPLPSYSSNIADYCSFSTSGTSHHATASTTETAARAARVRQHHPLVTRTRSNEHRRRSIERRTFKVSVPSPVPSNMLAKGSSSCASERMSVGNGKRNSGSSTRHYWDFGGNRSVGSGSLVSGAGGGMGSWGEV